MLETIVNTAFADLGVSGDSYDEAQRGLRHDELEDVHGPLLLDLRRVTFIDASGIAALVQLAERCPHHECTFRLEACSPPVERVLRIVGLYDLLTDGVAVA